MRFEGKDYTVCDADIITFKFNVWVYNSKMILGPLSFHCQKAFLNF
jgi:hypothetical protein